MNRVLPAIVVAAVILTVIIGGIFIYQRTTGGPVASGPGAAQQQGADRPGSPQGPGAPGNGPAAPMGMSFQRLAIDTSTDQPEACLVFSQELDQSGTTNYGDYIRISPETPHDIRVNGNSLCITGLAYATQYTATILEGLPSVSGATTVWEETVPIALADRPPAAAFSGGIILPRESEGLVPITTVNIETLKVRVLRVGDRLLSQLYSGLVDSTELYDYDTYSVQNELGSLVWEGEMPVAGAKNETVTTLIPLREAVGDEKAGVYLVLASDVKDENRVDYYWGGTAAQWVVDTDIGLTSFHGADGLHVYARSLSGASPMAGVELALVARNNEELARQSTDGAGGVHFAPELLAGAGGDEPVVVMAYGNGDFTYLDLRRAAFDLTDRGVAGRDQPGPIDAYLYTERGIYRPGETVYVTTLLRDTLAKAVTDAPLTLIVRRPDGLEYRRLQLDESRAGAAAAAIALSASAPRGRWEVAAYVDPTAPAIGRVTFDVQDFVPERLAITLAPEAAFYRPGDQAEIGVEARFLYGAPASNMAGEGEMRLSIDYDPFPELGGYSFGRVEDPFSGVLIPLQIDPTDAQGKTTARAVIDIAAPTSNPLMADISIGLIEPGGRVTREYASVPVRTTDVMIGIRPAFEDGWVRENTAANFEVIAVDAEGKPLGERLLTYRFVEEVVNYHWYEMDGRWMWERQVRDLPIDDGTLTALAGTPSRVETTQDWGSYRLIVSDNDSGASSSVSFWVGWGGSSGADRPDRVAVTLDKDAYKPGEQATLEIHPPSNGKALIVIASDRVHMTKLLDVKEAGATFSFTVGRDWGAGVYALVTHYRGTGQGNARAPVRSIGLAWLGIDQSEKTLAVAIAAPEKAKPQTSVDIPISVANASGNTFITLAAVDEGILQLTDFVSPSATDRFFGKRRLGLEIRDDYGRLIEAEEGAVGELRSGGDGFGGGEGLTVVPTRTVALYSGIVPLDSQGRGVVPLQIPDYVGELRLMAVAFNGTQLGEAEAPLTVRDEVVADLTLPRFLAPADAASATLLVDNVEGQAGRYEVVVTTDGAVNKDQINYAFTLAAGAKEIVAVPITAGEPGIGTVALSLKGPGGIALKRSWPIEVRPPQRPETTERVAELGPGETLTLPAELFAGFYPDTARLSVTLASQRAYDVPGLLRWLDRYPYGCVEQTTSRAYPLLVFNELAPQAGVATDDELKGRIQSAVNGVLDMQSPAGNFGMWGWGSQAAYDWLSVYALDFLMEAKARDYVVPQDALNRGATWLRSSAAQSWSSYDVRSYAIYVLARHGAANLSDLRYYHDTELANMKLPMAAAHLGAALAQMGDRSRAHSAFAKALQLTRRPIATVDMPMYGSDLREVAGVTYLAARSGETQILPALFERTMALRTSIEETTTQEKAWMLLAASALAESQGPLSVAVRGVETSGKGPVYLASLKPGETEGVEVKNTGGGRVWYTIAIDGTHIDPMPALSQGVSMSKSYYLPDGSPASLTDLKQSDKVIVVIRGRMTDINRRQMGVMDLLPAGLEIDAPLSPGAEGSYPWLPALTYADLNQKRDDRYVAAFTIQGSTRTLPNGKTEDIIPDYALAYIARAVTPGTFVLPGATIEDMYAPQVKARTDVGSITVAPPAQ